MGHTHCNVPHPHGKTDTGFMVAGQGMEGCGNYGMPIVDTTGGRVRVWHFESAKMVCEGIGHSRAISAMQFSPDDKQLVSVGVDGSVLLWNVYV